MKKITVLIAVVLMMVLVGTANAQITNAASQTLTLAVDPIYLISVSGNPSPMTITTGTPGSDNLTAVSDNTTTYSLVHNNTAKAKITASLDQDMPSGLKLEIALGGGAAQDISAAATTAVDVVTAISAGFQSAKSIAYTFSATASAGTFSGSRTVTLTLSAN